MNIGKAHISVLATTIGKPRTFDGKPIHGRGGISAVVLRRGGKLVTVPVAKMLSEARQYEERATYSTPTPANHGAYASMAIIVTKPKKTKRKGRRK